MPTGARNDPQYISHANADGLKVETLSITAPNVPLEGPDMEASDGFALVVMSDPGNTALNFVSIAGIKNHIGAPNRAIRLGPGQSVPLRVKNARSLWISGTIAGDVVVFYTERIKTAPVYARGALAN